MMKKWISVLLIITMLLTITACGKKEDDTGIVTDPTPTPSEQQQTEEPSATPVDREPSGQIIIGNTTELSGDWVPYFQNNAADYDVYLLVTGYGTVQITADGKLVVNETVVEKYEVIENDDGSKTYKWTIKDGLTYHDGTPITAYDYVTTIMIWSSSVVGEMGADNSYGYYLKGWKDFAQGNKKEFPGVNLIDEKTFAMTIDGENLPYFYELDMAAATPTRLSYWTDENVTIKDDGNGCYFSDNFTKEAYEAKINEARGKTKEYPASGPYYIESYDEASKVAVLKVNDKYLGNWEGQKPNIETIIYKKVTTETALDELKTGSVDLLNGMNAADEINAGLDLVEQGGFAYTAYDRAGYGKLQFACDFGPTQFIEVRQALAHLLDRNDFAKAFTGGFGSVVNGPYGIALWFYKENEAILNEKLNQYPYSLEKAIELLEKGGWVYDENGNEYKEGIRYKKLEDGTLMPLIIEWASSEANPVSELLVVKLQENPDVAKAGIKINQTIMTFSELLNWLYRDTSESPDYAVKTYHMFNLATGYTPIYDRSTDYTTDPVMIEQGYNTNFIVDEELERLAKEMVLTEPGDNEAFKKKFVDFVVRWNELLPDLPLYSNIYHDFYNAKLKNYNVTAIFDLADAIVYAYVEE